MVATVIPRDWDEQRDWVLNHPLEAADIVADAVVVMDIFTQGEARNHAYHTRLDEAIRRLAQHDSR